jgi:hypothetical protein
MSQVQALIEQAVQQAEAAARAVAGEALAEVAGRLKDAEAKIESLEARLATSGLAKDTAAAKPVASRTRTTKA